MLTNALINFAKKNGVKIICNSKVKEIIVNEGTVSGVKLENGSIFEADSVIIATGGMSYPGTGSDGDGYKFATKLGHTITELRPSLVGLITEEKWVQDLQGLSLKNVEITLRDSNNKKVYSDFGEMLFTHFGISGPIVLSASSNLSRTDFPCVASIDLKPALDEEKLDKRLLRDFEENINKDFQNALDKILPRKIIPKIIERSRVDPHLKVHQITKNERLSLVDAIKNFKINIRILFDE